MTGLLSAKDPTFDERGQRIPHRGLKQKRLVAAPSGQLALDLRRGRTDKVWFNERFLGIREHPGQRRFSVAATMRAEDGYSPAFLDIAQSSGNQAGKTLNLATTVFHQTFYKLGLPWTDYEAWQRTPFNWYHISYEGKVSYLVHRELQLIFNGSHPAQQGRGCPIIDELGPIADWEKRELGEYPWVRIHPAFGGGEIHFRHTNEKAKALLGIAMNGISFDEAAFELYLPEIRQEVLNLRRITTGGPIYWISTGTEGYNAFADVWAEGDPENPSRHPRSLSLRMSTRDNIGYGITQSQFDSIIAQMDERLIPQNIDGHFIEATDAYFHAGSVEASFDTKMPPEEAPLEAHRYAQGVDPGISHDATAAITLDITQRGSLRGVRARKRQGRQALPAVVNMVREGHLLYQQDGAQVTTLLDDTGMGGKMFRQEFSIIRPLRTYDFAGTKAKKLQLLSNLKAVIDRGELHLPRSGPWVDVRRQLLGYKLDDKHLDTDLVMALALAVHHAVRNPMAPDPHQDFDYFGGTSD